MSKQQSTGPGQEPEGLSTPQLETELLGLAGHLAAAQCRFLQLLAEFDRRNGWAGPGLRSCAHWLCWRIGMNLRTAREQLRVAHALAELPAITAAFAAGRLSYSKVRAITRVTAPASGCLDPEHTDQASADQPSTDQPSTDQPSADAATVLGPADPSASTNPAATDHADAAEAPYPPLTDIRSASQSSSNLLAPDAEETLLQLALAGTASHVESVVRATRRRQGDPQRAAALRTLSWRWEQDGSLVLRARLAPAEGAALVAAIEAELPQRPSAGHPLPEPPPGWKESAVEQEPGAVADLVGARRADALVRLVSEPGGARGSGVSRGQVRVIVHIGGTAGGAEIEGGPEIPDSTAERLSCDADAQVLVEDPTSQRLYFGRSRRLASPAQIAALTIRDGGTCQFPGCTHTRYLRAHHVVHWLHGGRTDLDNLVLICTFHHDLIHERGFRMRSDGAGWAFLRPDGKPVPDTTAPLVGKVESLIERNTRAELAIGRSSLTPTWAGERLDPEPILDRLLPRSFRAAA